MQTTLYFLAAISLLVVGNLASDPLLALCHTQLRQLRKPAAHISKAELG